MNKSHSTFAPMGKSSGAKAHRFPHWTKLGLCTLLLVSCASDRVISAPARPAPAQAGSQSTLSVPIPAARPAPGRAPAGLVSAIQALGASFNGKVGIAVRSVESDWEVSYNGSTLMPQQSVSKLWVAMTVLDAVDRGKLTLNDQVTIRPQDLTLFHQPIAQLVGTTGYTTTLDDLLDRALTQSDNTANDTLLRRVGGPQAVRGFLARRYISNIRFGPGERLMQSETAGLEWNQSMSQGRAFYAARSKLPMPVRQKALEAYIANPSDGAAASSIAYALASLKRGDMLSPASSAYILSTMEDAKTGPKRVKGGVPAGWSYGHKTGTGQELGTRQAGYNDVGIMTAPDGKSYAIAVMIGSTTEPIPVRWDLMQSVARAVATYHDR